MLCRFFCLDRSILKIGVTDIEECPALHDYTKTIHVFIYAEQMVVVSMFGLEPTAVRAVHLGTPPTSSASGNYA